MKPCLAPGSPMQWGAERRYWCCAPPARTPRCSTAHSPRRVSTRALWPGRVRWRCSTCPLACGVRRQGRAPVRAVPGPGAAGGSGRFPGVALTGDERGFRAVARDDVERVAHERHIDRLVADQGVRALCRYPVRDGGGVLHEVLRLHHRDVLGRVCRLDGRLGRGCHLPAAPPAPKRLPHVTREVPASWCGVRARLPRPQQLPDRIPPVQSP
jgi:hypothetical protein